MKTRMLPVLVLVVAFVRTAVGGWETSGNNIYAIGSNVGIGTTSPQQLLSVNGALNVDQANANNGSSCYPGITFGSYSGEGIASNRTDNGENNWGLDFYTCAVKRMSITWGGNVGIGTIKPEDKLTLDGNGPMAYYLLSVGGSGNGRMKVRHIDGKDWQSNNIDGLYLQYGINKHTIMNAGGSTGNVGIGTESPQAKLDVVGTTATDVLVIRGGVDLAEPFLVEDKKEIPPGALMVIDDRNPGHLRLSDCPYDKRVAGVVSGAGGLNPGLTLTQKGIVENGVQVALTGRVYALADTSNGDIEPGDLLTTSGAPGHAMKATDADRSYGAVIGKAMSPLKKGRGLVLVLVSLQ